MLWKNFHTLSNSDPPILQPRKKGLLSRLEFKPSAETSSGSASHPGQFQSQVPENFDDDAVRPLICYAIHKGIDYEALAQAQTESADVQLYRTSCTGLRLKDVPFDNGSFSVLCDISTGRARPIVPEAWREAVFHAVHGLSHPGIETTKKLVSTKFVWHGLKKYTHAHL